MVGFKHYAKTNSVDNKLLWVDIQARSSFRVGGSCDAGSASGMSDTFVHRRKLTPSFRGITLLTDARAQYMMSARFIPLGKDSR